MYVNKTVQQAYHYKIDWALSRYGWWILLASSRLPYVIHM